MMKNLPYSDAAERNREPILQQLHDLLPDSGTVLEIGSGSGQHATFFARHLQGLHWQPTDRHENLSGLVSRLEVEGNARILSPLKLDVLSDPWPKCSYAAAYSANTAHIMSWQAVQAMFEGVARHLVDAARFCLYGPFNIDGAFTSSSNARFDVHLRATNPHMGIRDMSELESLANAQRMQLEKKIAMPANNFILVFVKQSSEIVA